MDTYPEVIVVTGANGEMYNAENGNMIRQLNVKLEFHPKTFTMLGEDYLVGALANRPVLKVFTVSKKLNSMTEFTMPGMATSFGATSCGSYCFAGIGKDVYAWKVSTGNLLAIVSKHYQEVTCIKCSSDDSHVLTAGRDGLVNVWLLADLLAVNRVSNQKNPRFTWNHHSAEITDIHLTSLGNHARVATVSLDMTCRLYELGSGVLITTVFMESPLTAVTMDTLDCFVFIGDVKGSLHRINIFERLPRETHATEMKNSEFKIHESKIVSLNVSLEGNKLVSSSEDGFVRVWDMQSLSCILRIKVEGTITNAFIALRPTCFMKETILPIFEMVFFKRNLAESRERQATSVRPGKRIMSDMIGTPNELCYNPSNRYKDTAAGEEASKSAKFVHLVNEPILKDMVGINQNVYTQSTKLMFESIETLIKRDDPDEEMSP